MEQSKAKVKLAIFSASILMMGVMAIASGLQAIAEHYKGVAQTSIQLLITLPCVVIIVVNPIVGKLQEYVSMKALALFGIACFLVGGVAPGFIDSFGLTLFLRGVLGIGVGTVQVLSSALVAVHFDGDERSKVMGQQTSAQMLGCAAMVFASGYLAVLGWNFTFYVHFLALLSFILVWALLPATKPVKSQGSAPAEKVTITKAAMGWAATLALFFVGGMILATYMAFFIAERKFGSPAQAGQATMVFAIGGFLIGLVFGNIMRVAKNVTLAIGLFLGTIAYLLIAFAPSMGLVYAGSLVYGFSVSVVMASVMIGTSMSVAPIAVPLAISIAVAGQNLGSFVCPYIVTPIAAAFGGGVNTSAFTVGAILFAAMGAAALAWGLAKNAKQAAKA